MLDMRALMGTALTPALPMRGLIFLDFGRKMFMNLTKSTPEAVAMMKAIAPRKKM